MTSNYSYSDIVKALKKLGLKKGSIVFSHSNIGFLGRLEASSNQKDVFNTILNAFLEVIGEEGTLIVPTFTYSFPKGKLFDPNFTPSDCGVFTEMLRKFPNVYRSEDPCVSVAAIGKCAIAMTKDVPVNAFGPDSFFDRLYKNNGIICNINFDAGSTFIHYVERELQVQYRQDKTFSGLIQKNGAQETRTSILYARCPTVGIAPRYDLFSQLAEEKALYHIEKVGRGFIGAISTRNVFNLIKETLPVRPLFLTEAEV